MQNVNLTKAAKDGVFPDFYYTTTNLETYIRLNCRLIKVENIEMDKGIKVNPLRKSAGCICGNLVKKGDLIVVGEAGVKVEEFKDKKEKVFFGFMGSEISSERNKDFLIRRVAWMMKKIKKQGGKILFVGGPAIVHTGGGRYLAEIIKKGFVDILFAGNALAVHDLEEQFFGTSLGFEFKKGDFTVGGNHHHLWTINLVRKHGSIGNFLKAEKIKKGIMYECLRKKINFVLAGSIRDDGPLPEVITDTQEAQYRMRRLVQDNRVKMAIMCATTLHSIAAGNLLSAEVEKVVVDINQAMITKLADRGTTNTVGIVTDTEPFLKELSKNLN